MLINFTNSKNNILLTTTNCFQVFCFYNELTICERIISLPLKCFQPQTFAHLDSFKSNKHCKTKFQCHIQPLSVNLHLMQSQFQQHKQAQGYVYINCFEEKLDPELCQLTNTLQKLRWDSPWYRSQCPQLSTPACTVASKLVFPSIPNIWDALQDHSVCTINVES